jgi:hypothetical protein
MWDGVWFGIWFGPLEGGTEPPPAVYSLDWIQRHRRRGRR